MATYTVNISGILNSSYAYATLNGTKTTTTGTTTYTSKPTIAVYVSSSSSYAHSYCEVTLNGTTVKSGYGSYTLDIGEADIVNITFASAKSGSYTYYTCDITTKTSDPMAPYDGHNTNIGAVAFQIESGTVRFGGAAYEIEGGMTRVNGVAMEILFMPSIFTVTITGRGHQNICYLTINGTKHYSKKTLEVEAGTEIVFFAQQRSSSSSGSIKSDSISLNGTIVNTPGSRDTADCRYTHTMTGNIRVELGYESGSDSTYRGPITITEE